MCFKDTELFQQEHNELLQMANSTESLVFGHNDIHEKNYLHNDNEIIVIDFEYSQLNYRSYDIAMYIGESFFELNDELPNLFKYHPDKVPDFDNHVPGTIDIDYVLTTYLKRFYEKHAADVIPNFYQTYPNFESYLNAELPVLKEQTKGMYLQHCLFWANWAIVMTQSTILNPVTGELWSDEHKLSEAFEKLSKYFLPNIKTRLEMYFDLREKVMPNHPSLLKP